MNKSGAANVASQARSSAAQMRKASKAATDTTNCGRRPEGHTYGPDPQQPESPVHRACTNCGVGDFYNKHVGGWVNDYNDKQQGIFRDRRQPKPGPNGEPGLTIL